MIRIDIATLFTNMCENVIKESIIGRAIKAGHIEIYCHDIRNYTEDKHRRVDDKPYGGGTGMVMQAQPIYDCICDIKKQAGDVPVFYMSPKGRPLTQDKVKQLASLPGFIILCGHYEGVDERVLEELCAEEISIGDYVLTGGELPALVLSDAVARLQQGVLPNEEAYSIESHYNGLLEHPQYTRPEVWRERPVPEVLLTGDHSVIEKWQQEQALSVTARKRPDMLYKYLSEQREFDEYVCYKAYYKGKTADVAILCHSLLRKRVYTNREEKDVKKITDMIFKTAGFVQSDIKILPFYSKNQRGIVFEWYNSLTKILQNHDINYEIIYKNGLNKGENEQKDVIFEQIP